MAKEDFDVPKKHNDTMELLMLALMTGNVQIMKCTDRKTEEPIWCIMVGNGLGNLAPVAKLFEGDSCIEMRPPNEISEGDGYGHN
jgi:hypothetical protein